MRLRSGLGRVAGRRPSLKNGIAKAVFILNDGAKYFLSRNIVLRVPVRAFLINDSPDLTYETGRLGIKITSRQTESRGALRLNLLHCLGGHGRQRVSRSESVKGDEQRENKGKLHR